MAEILVVISVLTLFVLLLAQLLNHTASITTLSHKRMDADSQARPLFERIALDFAHLVKRQDVSYFLKTRSTPMIGNDLLGFYSAVPGFFPTSPSPISVVAYRVNSNPANSLAYSCFERMGKGLDWNGASPVNTPFVFLPLTLADMWPSVTSSSSYDDVDPAKQTYEIVGPQVFRFEYYYVEKGTGNLVAYPSGWVSLPDVSINDATAIIVAIAIIDSKSRSLLSNSQIATLVESLPDYSAGWRPGELLEHWQSALDGIANVPRPAISAIRLYERCFPISD